MAKTHPTRPQVEQLEERRLLAGNITFDSLTGVVTVEGTPHHDRLKLTYAHNGDIRVKLTGGAYDMALLPVAEVKEVVFDGNGGRDRVINFTTVPVQKIEPPARTQAKAAPTPPLAPPPPVPAPAPGGETEKPFQDHYEDPIGDGKSMESWSAPGRPAKVSIFFDPNSLSTDEVAGLQEAVATLNGLHAGITLVPTSSPNAQIVVAGKAASPSGPALADTAPVVGARIGTFANGKKDYQMLHAYINVYQNMPWWTGPGPVPIGAGLYDLRSAVTHELGHAVGLGGDDAYYGVNSDGYSAMACVLPGGVVRWNYSPNDVRELTYLY